MVMSATIDKGAVMIYSGQEVGEAGLGTEGFQGDDGRTTIFDYWGVPEHQKWMNGGKFDGALLNPEQRQLRQFYIDVLNLSGKNPALTKGDYIDITEHNIATGNFDQRVHAYIRHHESERLLIVTSFNDKDQQVKVQIPEQVWAAMGMDKNETYIARDLLWREVEVGFDKSLTFGLRLKPYSCFIFKIK
jgi:hypothetical protein